MIHFCSSTLTVESRLKHQELWHFEPVHYYTLEINGVQVTISREDYLKLKPFFEK